MAKGSRPVLLVVSFLLAGLPVLSLGQNPPPTKRLPAGPPAPQSTHYPILILAFGNDPNWSLRIGQKGPERLDRPGYPPIPLEPSDVTHEAAADSWTYHAKDSGTSAAVAVHLTREGCTDATNNTLTSAPPPLGKHSFRASVDHAQIGSLKGCARIAAELFPKINNQPDDEDDTAKKKPPAPTITNFKPPVAVAFIASDQRMILKRGAVTRVIPGKPGYDFSFSHDGKKLLFTRDEQEGPVRTINEYDFDSNITKELLRGLVRDPVWSPDDAKIAFLKFTGSPTQWQLWMAPISDPSSASMLSAGNFERISGWSDAHTVLLNDLNQFFWIGEDGQSQHVLTVSEICGDQFKLAPTEVRLHPQNSDLLLVSAPYARPPSDVPVEPKEGVAGALFFYEVRAKRRVLLPLVGISARSPEWSRDGLQIFFTGTDSSRRTATYRIFWDGTGLQKYAAGSSLVVGQ